MRYADATTLLRVLLAVLVVYLILVKFNPIVTILLIAVTMLMDALDGYFAVMQESNGKVGFGTYIHALMGDKGAAETVRKYKLMIAKHAKYGARMDVAGDRAVEYLMWIVFTYVRILPIFVIIIIVIRHSFVDALMGNKGTSSKMKSRFGYWVYSSNIGRGGINVVKFLAFAYLTLAYVWGYPLLIGYALTAILVAYILLRGAAEVYESIGA